MNSHLIYIAGSLSAELGSELYLKIKEMSQVPTVFCVDGSELDDLDEVGAEFLKKIATKLKERSCLLALAAFPKHLEPSLQSLHLLGLFPSFPNSSLARAYLEEQALAKPSSGNRKEPTSLTRNSAERAIHCPNCGQGLLVRNVGDHSCPKCHHKFFVNAKGWVSSYERLA
ncbi:protein NinF [Leptospira ryugenii]|uniref:protein NinF n=1 Tax=Leptospira ryugenii TaxID=1917863 RepID=UPI000D58E196|nr:protein NinF [Leptospira ryugenii]